MITSQPFSGPAFSRMRAAFVLSASLIPVLATADTVYRLTDLGELPGGGILVEAIDINNRGEVAGFSVSAGKGFIWDAADGMHDLGQFRPGSINNAGEIIGTTLSGPVHAAVWDEVSGIQDLGDLPGGDNYSQGFGINDAGQAVGSSSHAFDFSHAFLWDSVNGMEDLGSLGGTNADSWARAINSQGLVVGETTTQSGGLRAFLWDGVNGMQSLGKLPGGNNDTSSANDINDAGVVVGYSVVTGNAEHAFIWDSADGMRDLGTLPGDGNYSLALGINSSGQVVGTSGAPSGPRAVLWNEGSIVDLNDAVDPSDPLAEYVTLLEGRAINDSGHIAATGTDSRIGGTHAYLLTPMGGDFYIDLASLTDVNGNGTADVATLVADLEGGSTVYVNDGGDGDPISEIAVLNADWRGLDIAVTPGGAGAVIGVLARKNDGAIAVVVHRARDGAPVREIPFFGPRAQPSGLAYVPNAVGPGGSAFAVIAKNMDDQRVSVQLRKRSDGSLINTNRFFLTGWEAIDFTSLADINGNNRPELLVLARSDAGLNQVVIRDAEAKAIVNKTNYFGPGTTPKAAAILGDIGGGAAPEVTVLGELPDGRHSAQNRDALTDERISSVSFFSPGWTTIGVEGLADVNGNGSSDLVVLAQHDVNHAIRAQVRDAFTGDLIRLVNFLGPTWSPRALATFTDIDGNGIQELGIVGVDGDGSIRVQLKDAASGSTVSTVDIR